jgi:hypothetical protein
MNGIVWLASYPKSGNTWVRLFLSALRTGNEVDLERIEGTAGIANGRALLERHLDLNLADLSWEETAELRPVAYRAIAKMPSGPVIMKVHDSHGTTPAGVPLFPAEATSGCVHLVRDPRDVCLSLAAHNGVSIDKAIASLGNPKAATEATNMTQVMEHRGSWSSHGESWLAAPFRRMTVRYEDMVAEPVVHLDAIARFCGIEAAPEAMARAVAAAEFSKLAAQEAAAGFRERPKNMARFFRAGKAEQWRDVLAPEQIERIEQDHGALMRRLGYALVAERRQDCRCGGL